MSEPTICKVVLAWNAHVFGVLSEWEGGVLPVPPNRDRIGMVAGPLAPFACTSSLFAACASNGRFGVHCHGNGGPGWLGQLVCLKTLTASNVGSARRVHGNTTKGNGSRRWKVRTTRDATKGTGTVPRLFLRSERAAQRTMHYTHGPNAWTRLLLL